MAHLNYDLHLDLTLSSIVSDMDDLSQNLKLIQEKIQHYKALELQNDPS